MSDGVKLDKYIRVARAKILKLIMRGDCIGVTDSSDNDVTLSFSNDKCTVNKWGRVDWIGDNNDT